MGARMMLLVLLLTTAPVFSAPEPAPRPPNLILILADDLGYGDLGCYGSTLIQTPHLDRMAAEGLRFTDFHSNGAVCSPTRAALLTGRYQQRTGVVGVISAANHREDGLPLAQITFAEQLRPAGYRTALFGKWHQGYAPGFNPVHQGFDEFRGFVSGNVDYYCHVDQAGYFDWWIGDRQEDELGYQTELITGHALRFIRENQDRPFCLYLPYGAPHTPNQDPWTSGQRVPRNLKGSPEGKAFVERANEGVPTRTTPLPTDRKQAAARVAYNMIEYLDACVGRIMDELEELELDGHTLVVFASDNGPRRGLSAGPLRGAKGSIYEGGHRVPCIARWPGRIDAGRVTDVPAMTLDLFPTFAAAAGVQARVEHPLDGIDLGPLLFQGASLPGRDLCWSLPAGMAIRRGPWKLIVSKQGRAELFHLEDDPAESTNRTEQEPERTETLRRALQDWYRDVTSGVRQFGVGAS